MNILIFQYIKVRSILVFLTIFNATYGMDTPPKDTYKMIFPVWHCDTLQSQWITKQESMVVPKETYSCSTISTSTPTTIKWADNAKEISIETPPKQLKAFTQWLSKNVSWKTLDTVIPDNIGMNNILCLNRHDFTQYRLYEKIQDLKPSDIMNYHIISLSNNSIPNEPISKSLIQTIEMLIVDYYALEIASATIMIGAMLWYYKNNG